MKEFTLIEKLRGEAKSLPGVRLGIGDDAAVLARDHFDLVALDTMVEGLHFRRDFSSPQDIGWKLLACNLSDIAAMGGRPGAYFLSLSLGEGCDEAWTSGLFEGLEAAAKTLAPDASALGAVGGDTTGSPGPTVLSLTLMGTSPEPGPIVRTGAQPGDLVILMGRVGLAAAGLSLLMTGEDGTPWPTLLRAHRRPHALSRLGDALGHSAMVHAMLDVSDGLLQDLGHVLRASGVGASLCIDHVPLDKAVVEVAQKQGVPALRWALSGGDDYALVATIAPARLMELARLCETLEVPMAALGEITAEPGLRLRSAHGDAVDLDAAWRGHEHTLGGA